MRERLRGKAAYLIIALVAIVLVVVWYFLLFSPVRERIAGLEEENLRAQASLAQAKSQVARLESYKRTAPQSRAEIVRLSKMLPESEGIPSLILELSQTAKAAGIDLMSITRGEIQSGTPFGIQTITLQVSGRYFDIEDFLYRLENYVIFRNQSLRVTGRLLQVTNLSLAGGGSEAGATGGSVAPLTVSIDLNAYLWGGSSATAGASSSPTPAASGSSESLEMQQ